MTYKTRERAVTLPCGCRIVGRSFRYEGYPRRETFTLWTCPDHEEYEPVMPIRSYGSWAELLSYETELFPAGSRVESLAWESVS